MNIYKISQDENNDYDTFDSAIVFAKSEDEARNILPADYVEWGNTFTGWCSSPNKVTVELIGKAIKGIKKGVILASYNAG